MGLTPLFRARPPGPRARSRARATSSMTLLSEGTLSGMNLSELTHPWQSGPTAPQLTGRRGATEGCAATVRCSRWFRTRSASRTVQAQRPSPLDAWIAARARWPGSLQRMVRPQVSQHTQDEYRRSQTRQLRPVLRQSPTAHAIRFQVSRRTSCPKSMDDRQSAL